MGTSVASIDVDVPIAVAYDQWTHLERFPAFVDGVESVRETGADQHHWVTRIAGVEREFHSQVLADVPRERIEWVGSGGVNHRGAVTFESASPERTTITVRLELSPRTRLEGVAERLGLVNHRLKSAMSGFKQNAEALMTGVELNATHRSV